MEDQRLWIIFKVEEEMELLWNEEKKEEESSSIAAVEKERTWNHSF